MLLLVALIAGSRILVLLPVLLSVAGGSSEVSVADNMVEHVGGYRSRICIVWWRRWFSCGVRTVPFNDNTPFLLLGLDVVTPSPWFLN